MDKSYREIYTIKDKEYWINFWFFNKKNIIAVLIACAMFIYGVVSCSNLNRPDAGIIIITQNGIMPGCAELIQEKYSPLISDVNGDGKTVLNVVEICFPKNAPDEMDYASTMRINTELLNSECNVVIGEEHMLQPFYEKSGFFIAPPESTYPIIYNTGKEAVALNISDSAFAEDIGYEGSGLCLACAGCDADSPVYLMYEEGKKIAGHIAKN